MSFDFISSQFSKSWIFSGNDTNFDICWLEVFTKDLFQLESIHFEVTYTLEGFNGHSSGFTIVLGVENFWVLLHLLFKEIN